MRSPLLDLIETAGVLLFVAAGAAPLLGGHAAMANLMPLGQFRDLYSGGVMVVTNFAVALAVAAGFAMLLLEFLEETRAEASDNVPDEEDR
jgi:multicomponent Na+:H+ antiporter subunit B